MRMRFKDKDIEGFWLHPDTVIPRRVPSDLRRTLFRKLQILDAAHELDDLRVLPGNRLELLKGDRQGQHSIRVNAQWRLCFIWTEAGPEEVEFCDYHK